MVALSVHTAAKYSVKKAIGALKIKHPPAKVALIWLYPIVAAAVCFVAFFKH